MSTKRKSRYNIEKTNYWRKWRQGIVETSNEGRKRGYYSRRKRNYDIRYGARMNFGKDFVKGAIRKQRMALEADKAKQIKLMHELGILIK